MFMNKKRIASLFLMPLLSLPVHADNHRSPAPSGAEVYFISPAEGSTVSNPVKVQFGLKGMGVAPAGVEKENTGHHHLLIDTDPASLDMNQPLPATDLVRHFGGGQTEVELTLPAGDHSLQLLLGNFMHVPNAQPVMSNKITIHVK
ncbi:MAG: DUF4399 domain-containing protein [Hahellaceae bacterium]|nr:DUF4399 domain-containing protein [Hahellaceae bacterium]